MGTIRKQSVRSHKKTDCGIRTLVSFRSGNELWICGVFELFVWLVWAKISLMCLVFIVVWCIVHVCSVEVPDRPSQNYLKLDDTDCDVLDNQILNCLAKTGIITFLFSRLFNFVYFLFYRKNREWLQNTFWKILGANDWKVTLTRIFSRGCDLFGSHFQIIFSSFPLWRWNLNLHMYHIYFKLRLQITWIHFQFVERKRNLAIWSHILKNTWWNVYANEISLYLHLLN